MVSQVSAMVNTRFSIDLNLWIRKFSKKVYFLLCLRAFYTLLYVAHCSDSWTDILNLFKHVYELCVIHKPLNKYVSDWVSWVSYCINYQIVKEQNHIDRKALTNQKIYIELWNHFGFLFFNEIEGGNFQYIKTL